jgi:NAD+ synthase (glutamine-hydrolysing)
VNFYNLYRHGFARVAACTVPLRLADPLANAATIAEQVRECAADAVALAVFPELGLCGYSLEDLLLQDVLLDSVEEAIEQLAADTADTPVVTVVGAPLRSLNRLYNCAVVLCRGEILGVVPKSYVPMYREFYEGRHFAAGDDVTGAIAIGSHDVPFGTDLLFRATDLRDFILAVEVCEDLWVPIPPSAEAALAGATVIANLSSSPITIARAEDRRLLVTSTSSRCLAGYVYAAAGVGESSTDLSWDGQTLIAENGVMLAEGERFAQGAQRTVADVDLATLAQERYRQGTFDDNRRHHSRIDYRWVEFEVHPPTGDVGLRRGIARFPFVPASPERLAQDCYEGYNIQVAGLVQRLGAIGNPKVVIGVSGGLDSTQALIVAARAMDRLGRPRSDILAFTMPGFATSAHTRSNAEALAWSLGVAFETLDITTAARQLLTDIDHPFAGGEPVYDVTFENVQAGLRTDYLFRLANQRGGIVLGTGDLSELALGWCTYGVGDHMSHYNVNGGVPKTLMQHLIRWIVATDQFGPETSRVLQSILDTEISPELIPVANGEAPQSTQATVGPYPLQDFTLYYVLRHGMAPSKIAFLAWHAWRDAGAGEWPANFPADERASYDLATIRHWLQVFCRKFFGFAQFKRSALPNGPKVVHGGSLSPRGDWRAPSDTSAALWLADVERNVPVR